MSSQTETEHINKSRKLFLCSWCGDRIDIGDPYKRYRFFHEGEAGTVREHPECFKAMDKVVKSEGSIEFQPGDYRRGCTCQPGDDCKQCNKVT